MTAVCSEETTTTTMAALPASRKICSCTCAMIVANPACGFPWNAVDGVVLVVAGSLVVSAVATTSAFARVTAS